jgi:hypothetical protein
MPAPLLPMRARKKPPSSIDGEPRRCGYNHGAMTLRLVARASLAACLLLPLGCGDADDPTKDQCDRLRDCNIIEDATGLASCKDERDLAQSAANSCDACIDGASCGDLRNDACKKPCLGVISSVGGDPPPVSEPAPAPSGSSSSGQAPEPPPPEVTAFCGTLEQCQIRASASQTCEAIYVFGLQSDKVTLIQIARCDDCMTRQACDLTACQTACESVL